MEKIIFASANVVKVASHIPYATITQVRVIQLLPMSESGENGNFFLEKISICNDLFHSNSPKLGPSLAVDGEAT